MQEKVQAANSRQDLGEVVIVIKNIIRFNVKQKLALGTGPPALKVTWVPKVAARRASKAVIDEVYTLKAETGGVTMTRKTVLRHRGVARAGQKGGIRVSRISCENKTIKHTCSTWSLWRTKGRWTKTSKILIRISTSLNLSECTNPWKTTSSIGDKYWWWFVTFYMALELL